MKVHAYLLCYNEESIIKNILDYYSSFCSKIFLMDNMSTDCSVEIASEYSIVTIIPWVSNNGIDESLYVKMKSQTYKNYSRDGGKYTDEVADWIVSCDMDEVLYHPDIVNALKDLKKNQITVPQIIGLNVVGDNEIDPNGSIISQYNSAVRAEGFDKRILFDVDFDMAYSHGCHPRGSGFEHMKKTYGYKTSNKYQLALLHYKHIGERLYSSAVKNYSRLSDQTESNIGGGKTSLVGKYYDSVVQKNQKSSPLVLQGKRLFRDDMHIKFDNFSPALGEKDMDQVSQEIVVDGIAIRNVEIDLIRDVAMRIEKDDLRTSFNLMSLALKFRPSGVGIKNKVEEYRNNLSLPTNSSVRIK